MKLKNVLMLMIVMPGLIACINPKKSEDSKVAYVEDEYGSLKKDKDYENALDKEDYKSFRDPSAVRNKCRDVAKNKIKGKKFDDDAFFVFDRVTGIAQAEGGDDAPSYPGICQFSTTAGTDKFATMSQKQCVRDCKWIRDATVAKARGLEKFEKAPWLDEKKSKKKKKKSKKKDDDKNYNKEECKIVEKDATDKSNARDYRIEIIELDMVSGKYDQSEIEPSGNSREVILDIPAQKHGGTLEVITFLVDKEDDDENRREHESEGFDFNHSHEIEIDIKKNKCYEVRIAI